jgi:hypothetical protein
MLVTDFAAFIVHPVAQPKFPSYGECRYVTGAIFVLAISTTIPCAESQ